MDIRLAQEIAWDTRPMTGIGTNDVSMGFDRLSGEVAKASAAWNTSRQGMAEELAVITICLLRLAETIGTDLQTVVEAKLAATKPGVHRQPSGGLPAKDKTVTTAAAINCGKLVRDKIPQIIRSKGQEPVTYKAAPKEYWIRLREKLREEVEEYLASENDQEELADILEVIYALARLAGTDQQQLETLRAAKTDERGGFTDRIVWLDSRTRQPPRT